MSCRPGADGAPRSAVGFWDWDVVDDSFDVVVLFVLCGCDAAGATRRDCRGRGEPTVSHDTSFIPGSESRVVKATD